MYTTLGEREQNKKKIEQNFRKMCRLTEDLRERNRDHKSQGQPTRTRQRCINVRYIVHMSRPTVGEATGGPCQCSN